MTPRAHDRTITEADFLGRIVDLARYRGWLVSHQRPARTAQGWRTAVQGDAGTPDLLLARGGVVICAELKTQTGRLTPLQRRWGDALGDHYSLWRPADWETIVEELT